MGVPKFYRWLSERYPRINQRFGSPPNPETQERYFPKNEGEDGDFIPLPDSPDPLSTCGLPPEIDRLYLDMNGIIHGCSHNNSDQDDEDKDGDDAKPTAQISNEEIFRNVCYYLDRVIGDMVQPQEVVYMAIDGVAPRAKLNQQRSRRYRSGQEGAIETNIYEAHAKAVQKKEENDSEGEDDDDEMAWKLERDFHQQTTKDAFDIEDGYSMEAATTTKLKDDNNADLNLQEISPGRFKGKFETNAREAQGGDNDADEGVFHHNVITPGTEFFSEFSKHLEHFVKYKISTDPKWQNLSIIVSGPNVPGEGEHKIMDFIREQKASKDYNPNLRHCIMGQDGDLMMLGLATHEPNMVLLRERVLFNQTKQRLNLAAVKNPLDLYIHNVHFEFLHMGVLRDYLAYELETSNIIPTSPWDLERTIDDFVFMTFFVGNDFLPHMPALDIADNAFDLLFYTYKNMRKEWRGKDKNHPYLTNAGTIVSGQRLEQFLSGVGSHENDYYDKKKQGAQREKQRLRKDYSRFGMSSSVPDDDLVASKEQADRNAYRRMLEEHRHSEIDEDQFMPVMTSELDFEPAEEELEESFMSRMGSILQNSLSNLVNNSSPEARDLAIDDQDMKGRYYHDKFQFTPFDAEKHLALRKAYVEGLAWTLKYYYEGCVSWEWYYPYHYGKKTNNLATSEPVGHA
jgi:5'-3' exonuclease